MKLDPRSVNCGGHILTRDLRNLPGTSAGQHRNECDHEAIVTPGKFAAPDRGHGKWRGCAGKVLGLMRGDLPRMQSRATGEDLRTRPKGVENAPIPTAPRTARRPETTGVTEQKSAEVIVPGRVDVLPEPGKDRTRTNKEESCRTRNRR